jgi:hypothetical protein
MVYINQITVDIFLFQNIYIIELNTFSFRFSHIEINNIIDEKL